MTGLARRTGERWAGWKARAGKAEYYWVGYVLGIAVGVAGTMWVEVVLMGKTP